MASAIMKNKECEEPERGRQQTTELCQMEGQEEKPKRTIYQRRNLGKKNPKKIRTH